MESITLRARAKVNLALSVTGQLFNGFHSLDMLLTSVDIADVICYKKSRLLSVTMDGEAQDEGNTAYRAAAECIRRFGVGAGEITVKKHIPFEAGLGGSSADAAGVLYAIGRVYGLGQEKLLEVAAAVGSDVSFMLTGGAAQAKGKGDDLTFFKLPQKLHLLVVKPYNGVNSGEAFRLFDQMPHTMEARLAVPYKNDLYCASSVLNPDIKKVYGLLKPYTDKTVMTGSGSAVIGVFDTGAEAKSALDGIRKNEFVEYAEYTVTTDTGIEVTEEA